MEVYHTCSHSEVIASKLASGASSVQAELPQDTLIGTATAPLSDLLSKPQACLPVPDADTTYHNSVLSAAVKCISDLYVRSKFKHSFM